MALHYIIGFLILLRLIVNYIKYNTTQQKDGSITLLRDDNDEEDEKQKSSCTKCVEDDYKNSLLIEGDDENDREYVSRDYTTANYLSIIGAIL